LIWQKKEHGKRMMELQPNGSKGKKVGFKYEGWLNKGVDLTRGSETVGTENG